MADQLDLTDHQKDQLKEVIKSLQKKQSDLIEIFNKNFRSMAFENRYTLHPRRLKELGSEEVKSFSNFLQSQDASAVLKHGELRAQEGLGERPLLSLGDLLRGFFFGSMKDIESGILQTAIKAVDLYMANYLYGFMTARERQTLKDQEQLRIALSTALDRQRMELFIKNHAIHTSINGIMLTDLDGHITYVNPSFLVMWKYKKADEIMDLQSSQFWGMEKSNDILETLKKRGGLQNEFTATRRNGSTFEVVVSASLIKDDTNKPIGIMASFVDVTERKHLEAQFRQAQKMEAIGQLASGIVHDFNNLLTIISGYTELEMMNLPEDSEKYNNFMQIKIASDRGKDLTQQLRFFTRQDSGEREPVDLNNVVKETYNLLKHTFLPEINIMLNLDPRLNIIEADPSQMSQLLMNLCVNARDAMVGSEGLTGMRPEPRGTGGILTIETCNIELDRTKASRFINAKAGRYICIKVSDTGIGMSQQVIERLFEPFFTTKGKKSGTGLGLAVVYGIVRNHRGFIDVKSDMGEGSAFEIYLPVLEVTTKKSVLKSMNSNLAYSEGTILLVEDEKQVRELTLQALKKCGYRVLSAENGVQAISVYEERGVNIDLVILDVVMPEMGGWECFHRLKKMNPRVKVLIMTGYTANYSAQAFLNEGALGVVEKPFDLGNFTNLVRNVIYNQPVNGDGI